MRVLIVSDTHGSHENLELVLEKEGSFDKVIHLGDSEATMKELLDIVNCPLEVVAGNMDYNSLLPQEKIIEIGDYRILLCHGHRMNVNAGLLRLEYAAREKEVDIVLYGHTHVPFLEEYDDLIIFNPGSLSRPRPWGAKASYGVMTIGDDGEVELKHCYL